MRSATTAVPRSRLASVVAALRLAACVGGLALGRAPALHAQEPARPAPSAAKAAAAAATPRLALELPPELQPFGVLSTSRPDAERVARTWAEQLGLRLETATRRTLLGAPVAPADATGVLRAAVVPRPPAPTDPVPATPAPAVGGTTPVADTTRGVFDALDVDLRTRIETKAERLVDDRCVAGASGLAVAAGCRTGFSPAVDVQFSLKSAGGVGDRFHVNVDYDSQREFDASNQLAVWYEGKPGERLRRIELGNVSFAAPSSRFLGASVPAGNYGLQAEAQLGPVRLQAIAAQQKGNVVRDRQFVIGERALQSGEQEIEDWQIEPRRFFFAVSPRALAGWPAIDILDRAQLAAARAALPDTLRPTRLRVYRLQFGAPPQNPNGPRFLVQEEGVRRATGAQTYDVLREGVDYYADPSLLWFALVRPLNGANERLVVAYDVRVNGRDTTWLTTGGTPDVEATGREQVATLVWDPNVTPSSPAFGREIRSVYRIGGADLVRERTQVRVVAGAGDQEKPLAGAAETYLQMLGLAQPTNSAEFDVEQRLWPRRGDPVFNQAAGAGSAGDQAAPRIFGDHFLVLPSLRPFAARGAEGGLVEAGNPSNAAIYETPGEYLAFGSPRHPTSIYRLRVRTETEGSADRRSLMLGGVQLRRGSERISVDGVTLVRDRDYQVDYEIGQVTFTRADTLFGRPRNVSVRYEENPLFAATPTRLAGLTTQWSFPRGQLAFTAVSQAQASAFTRPELGFERAAASTAGLTGSYALPLAPLTRALSRLPWGATAAPSRLELQGELAVSRPEGKERQQAYLESFEGEGGIQIGLQDAAWQLSSLPAYGRGALAQRWGGQIEPERAAPLAWQTYVEGPDGRPRTFTLQQIDPQAEVAGLGAGSVPETLLWLTLRPHGCGMTGASGGCDWPLAPGPTRSRWRSIRTSLGAGGRDLSLAEQLEFWALVDTSFAGRARNPTLVLDLGEVSENTLAFAPETLTVRRGAGATLDSTFTGKRVEGFDRLDTERDPFTRAFDAAKNDRGLPGDRADSLVVIDETAGGAARVARDVMLCRGTERAVRPVGDLRASCTAGNGRLDEEDIDLDGALNITGARREEEQLLRYVIDLADPSRYARVGRTATVMDTVDGRPMQVTKQWVLVRVPFGAPDERVNEVLLRRVRALRLTMISGRTLADQDPSTVAIARMRLVAAPWVKRADGPVAGIAGDQRGPGFAVTSVIGTTDRDSTRGLVYEPPPGVTDEAETVNAGLQAGATQINERSLRILAGGLEPWHRVEAYHRFSAGQQSFMGYRELRLWARGRGEGWGPDGELQLFVRLGRDEHNFYLYRTSANAGATQSAWLPEVRVDLRRFQALRERLERDWLAGTTPATSCTGADSALIAASGLPLGGGSRRRAVCEDGYMVYSAEPGVTPPNLAAVQELGVGIVRVPRAGAAPLLPADTLELWVDDIRLARAVDDVGTAGYLTMDLVAADVAAVRLAYTRRGANFRQLNEAPSFVDEGALDLTGTVRLERLLPRGIGLSLPLTVTRTSVADDPLFLARTDVRARGVEGLRAPRTAVTTWQLAARRSAPVSNPLVGALVNNLVLNTTLVQGGSRTEYQDGRTRQLTMGLEYALAGAARTVDLPFAGPLRWSPTQLRVTSALARGNDTRDHFFKPASALDDDPRRTDARSHVWRTGTSLELRPTGAVTARWDAFSLRDLRRYAADSSPAARLADAAGGQLGFERERTMQVAVQVAPTVRPWLRPRLDLGTAYSMLRDPNVRRFGGGLLTPEVAAARDSVMADTLTGAMRDALREAPGLGAAASAIPLESTLPRRLTASQSLAAGVTVDLVGAMGGTRDSARAAGAVVRLARRLAPVDLTFDRNLLSAFDGAEFAPPLGFQLAIGGPGGFRRVRGTPATAAGVTHTLGARTSLALPFGTTLSGNWRRVANTSWTSRLDGTQAAVDGVQTVFPDAQLRWSWRPAAKAAGLVTGATASLRLVASAAHVTLPSLGVALDEPPAFRTTRVRTVPLTGSVTWGVGQLTTSGGLTLTDRTDSLPGSVARGRSAELSGDVGRVFRLPPSWGIGLRNDVRTRFGWQESRNRTVVDAVSAGTSGRLADNGRRALSLNADTDVSETMVFSLQGAHVVTTDRNLDRRLSQLVLSAVMQIQFYGGGK